MYTLGTLQVVVQPGVPPPGGTSSPGIIKDVPQTSGNKFGVGIIPIVAVGAGIFYLLRKRPAIAIPAAIASSIGTFFYMMRGFHY